jgi:hypothetical protein
MKNLNRRVIASISLVGLVLATLITPVHAVDTVDNTTTDPAQTARMTNLVQRADNEIDRRLVALNNLTAKISTLKRISDGQKSAFNSEIQTNITSLTNLKAKIDADTDLPTLKQDVQSIVDNYRIFALYMPKIHLLAGADIASDMAGSLGSLAIKLQNKITTDQQAGKDVATLQTLLTEMQTKVSDASNQAANITDLVIQLVPSGYPGNSTNLSSARDMLKTARADIQAASQDAQQIITGLKAFQKTSIKPATNG